MKDLILDAQRALLLLWVTLKFSLGPIIRRILGFPLDGVNYAVRIRLAMEELGPSFSKLGQFLAMRFDILPVEVCRELNMLFENVPPMTFEEAKAAVESELKGSLQEFFLFFNQKPIAAATVAQVHEAQTHANERVAVKIQRTGIERVLAADMRNLRRFAKVVDRLGLLGVFSAKQMADEFADWTHQEMNFILEGHTAERARKKAASYEIVPKIYWELTTSKVLTMEFVDGVSLSKISSLVEEGQIDTIITLLPNLDPEQAGRNIAFAILRQLFVTGFFHGDLHPGNILVRDDNKVAFVDFGIFGELSDEQRENLAGLVENIALGNIDESFQYFAKQYTPTDETDLRSFEQEAKSILRQWYQDALNPYLTAQDRPMSKYGLAMLEVVRRHQLRASTDILLSWRGLFYLDASASRLSDYFDVMRQMRNFFEQTRPGLAERVQKIITDRNRTVALVRLARGMPDYSGGIVSELSQGYNRWPLRIKESAASQRANNAETKSLALGMTGTSLIVISIAVDFEDMLLNKLFLALAILLIIFSVKKVRRR